MPIPLVLSGCGVRGPCLAEAGGSGGVWTVLRLPLHVHVEHMTMVDVKFLDMVAESPSISHAGSVVQLPACLRVAAPPGSSCVGAD